MSIYIITDEPYHENSVIVGATEHKELAKALAENITEFDDSNYEETICVTEWDTEVQQMKNRWYYGYNGYLSPFERKKGGKCWVKWDGVRHFVKCEYGE